MDTKQEIQNEIRSYLDWKEQKRIMNQIEWVVSFLILITICFCIILFNIAFASALYSGESYTFQTNLTDPVYTVSGNSSNIDGLVVEFDGNNITISTDILFKPDNFTLLFSQRDMETITQYVSSDGSSGSGGSRTKTVYKNQTVYVPEYVNNTETIFIDREVQVDSDNSSIMTILLGGIIISLIIMWVGTHFVNKLNKREEDDYGKIENGETNNGRNYDN